jgi:hypothetical protein
MYKAMMQIVKRLLIVVVLSLLISMLAIGCGPSYSEEGFEYVENYASEILPAIEIAVYWVNLWEEDTTDEALLAELKESSDEINEINDRYWTDEFPEYNEVKGWTLKRSRDDLEWTVDGNELAPALWDVKDGSDWLAVTLLEIYEAGGEIPEVNFAVIVYNVGFVTENMEELRWMLYRT